MVCSLFLSSHFPFFYSSFILSGITHPELVLSSNKFHSRSGFAHCSHQPSLTVDPGYSSNLFAQEQHFYSWESFRNQAMLCICLYDLLSPFILLQLLSQLSFLFSSNLCCSLTLLLCLVPCCSAVTPSLLALEMVSAVPTLTQKPNQE